MADSIQAYLDEYRCVGIRDLIDNFPSDDVFKAIAGGSAYIDLSADLLEDSAALRVYPDRATRTLFRRSEEESRPPPIAIPGMEEVHAGDKITWGDESYVVQIANEAQVSMRSSAGALQTISLTALRLLCEGKHAKLEAAPPDVRRRIADLTTQEIEDAVSRREALDAPGSSSYAPGTLAAYRRRIQGCHTYLDEIVALADDKRNRGNRTPRVPEQNRKLGSKAIASVYNRPEGASKIAAYGEYETLCAQAKDELGLPLRPVSYQAFCVWVDQERSHAKRGGKRFAYQQKALVPNLDNAFPRHGQRPHEVCYIDHTVATIATRARSGHALKKPTLSVALDGHTKNARALILSYEPPSARLVLQLMRDYWRRWGRWPKCISVDNGKEFHSRELAFFCKLLNIDIKYRPAAMPRFGASMERLLGATEEEVLGQMESNTRIMREPRTVTKSVNPFIAPVHTLESAYDRINEYLFNIRANRIHPELNMTPNEFEALRVQETGPREHVLSDRAKRELEEDINLLTAPHPHVWFHKVDQRRGVWVDNMWYMHPALRRLPKGSKVEVRVEPWLHRVVYVRVGKWLAAIGSNAAWCGNRTRREVEIALRAEKKAGPVLAKRDSLSARQRRAMNALHQRAPKFDETVALQMKETRDLYQRLGMTTALPIADVTRTHLENEPVASSAPASQSKCDDASFATPRIDGIEEADPKDLSRLAETGDACTDQALNVQEEDDVPGYY